MPTNLSLWRYKERVGDWANLSSSWCIKNFQLYIKPTCLFLSLDLCNVKLSPESYWWELRSGGGCGGGGTMPNTALIQLYLMCVCVCVVHAMCVWCVLVLLCIIVYYFNGMNECVYAFVLYFIIVLHYYCIILILQYCITWGAYDLYGFAPYRYHFYWLIDTLHFQHQNDSCIKMGSDGSHFHVSLIFVRDKITRQCQ